jgi:hypothetical protein
MKKRTEMLELNTIIFTLSDNVSMLQSTDQERSTNKIY